MLHARVATLLTIAITLTSIAAHAKSPVEADASVNAAASITLDLHSVPPPVLDAARVVATVGDDMRAKRIAGDAAFDRMTAALVALTEAMDEIRDEPQSVRLPSCALVAWTFAENVTPLVDARGVDPNGAMAYAAWELAERVDGAIRSFAFDPDGEGMCAWEYGACTEGCRSAGTLRRSSCYIGCSLKYFTCMLLRASFDPPYVPAPR